MGGIDEAALDRVSLVTEMTKHIRVRASKGRTTAADIGQFSPHLVWLLRDFYLNLAEDGRMITPREYLELALKSMPGTAKDVVAKNEVVLEKKKKNPYCTSLFIDITKGSLHMVSEPVRPETWDSLRMF